MAFHTVHQEIYMLENPSDLLISLFHFQDVFQDRNLLSLLYEYSDEVPNFQVSNPYAQYFSKKTLTKKLFQIRNGKLK